MALFNERQIVNYEQQQGLHTHTRPKHHTRTDRAQCVAAFEDFLQNFKSSSTEAAEQLEGLNINEDDLSDEYDMMDDSDDPAPAGTQGRNRSRPSKQKYMQILQEVSDRDREDITIDLNDLETVSTTTVNSKWPTRLTCCDSTRRA